MTSSLIRLIGLALLVLAMAACQSDEEKLAEHMSRGDEYFEDEAFGEAIIEYKNVLQIDPNDGEAHYKLAQGVPPGQEDRARASGSCAKRSDSIPKTSTPRSSSRRCCSSARSSTKPCSRSKRRSRPSPNRVEAYVVRAQVLEALKRPEEALEAYEKAVEIAPEDEGAILLYANALEPARRSRERGAWFVKLIEVAPNFRSYSALGSFLARRPRRVAGRRGGGRVPEGDRGRGAR